MHVRFFPLYKNKPKCPFYECCHVMLVILLVASICAVLTGWWSNSILARATACVSLRIDQEKKNNSRVPRIITASFELRNNPRDVLPLRFGQYHPAVLTVRHAATTTGTERFWFASGEFSCCPSLYTVNVYASTSTWIRLEINVREKLRSLFTEEADLETDRLDAFHNTFTELVTDCTDQQQDVF